MLKVVHIDKGEIAYQQDVTALSKILRAKWEKRNELKVQALKNKLLTQKKKTV